MSIKTLLTRYSLSARSEGLSPQTINHIKRCVGFFDDFIGGITDVRKITADDLKRFIVALQDKTKWSGTPQANGKHLSGTSINTYVRGVKSFWSWLEREGIIKINPLASVPAPKIPNKLPKILTEDDLIRVFKVASYDDRDYAIISLFLDSGIRLSELTRLTPDDVSNDGKVKVFGKGNKERLIPIGREIQRLLWRYINRYRPKPATVSGDFLFLTREGRPLTKDRMEKMMTCYGKKAGLTGVRCSPHTLRHSAAIRFLRNGGDVFSLQRMLGHSSLEMTKRYCELADIDVKRAHMTASPVDNLDIAIRPRDGNTVRPTQTARSPSYRGRLVNKGRTDTTRHNNHHQKRHEPPK